MTLVLFGPTATGKTALALKIARKYNGELISADSRQVYKNLDIGSGKIPPDSFVKKYNGYWIVNGIRINGYDLLNPEEQFSSSDFVNFASNKIKELKKIKKLPIVVGGTGFYIKSLVSNPETLGIVPNAKLRDSLKNIDAAHLYQKLQLLAPGKAKSLNDSDRKNPRRLIRAIEVEEYKKKSVTKNRNYNINDKYLILGLTAPNDFLYKKVDTWLDYRQINGLNDEVRKLLKNGVSSGWLTRLGLEYKWATLSVMGEIPQVESSMRLKGDIHSYVRRQKTFFKQFKEIKLYDITVKNYEEKIFGEVKSLSGSE